MPARIARLAGLVLAAGLLGACTARGTGRDLASTQPPQPLPRTTTPVRLGAGQEVVIASAFGPGSDDVKATVTVYRFLDHVAPRAPQPVTPGTRWASADVQVCRPQPVVLGYPAWVLGDDSGRTAQQSKVLRPELPQPAFPNTSTRTGCARGWVTWVVAHELSAPSKITFEQTRDVPGAWRLR